MDRPVYYSPNAEDCGDCKFYDDNRINDPRVSTHRCERQKMKIAKRKRLPICIEEAVLMDKGRRV